MDLGTHSPFRGLGGQPPLAISDYSQEQSYVPNPNPELIPDFLYIGTNISLNYPPEQKVIIDFTAYISGENHFPIFRLKEKNSWLDCETSLQFIRLSYQDLNAHLIELLKQKPNTTIILTSPDNNIYEQKEFIRRLAIEEVKNPVILHLHYNEEDIDIFRIKSAADAGSFFIDQLTEGIFLTNTLNSSLLTLNSCSFGILQATGRRISKTEYISCPGCGRTLFDLQTTLKKIKEATTHLKGLKIGVMGCIVNGPGEMADADYGYVGAGAGRISLYKGKECIKKNIPESKAVEELLKLIDNSN
jgi:(E)-4-hydroxy-3-methylbut-2-enyl-diphosphate synthase